MFCHLFDLVQCRRTNSRECGCVCVRLLATCRHQRIVNVLLVVGRRAVGHVFGCNRKIERIENEISCLVFV